ncbi:hypothetical protein AJ80_00325 [Polytolypa hystricis UAMH7299]|uniref:Uncharacterized protein n=1 Tax=Polytolypa hystricis (strain UAMH7299) TaxID=1447883 RepID=A0A2B7Z4A0_POLH7|nr:hypothetical protein AJ80_00325 [Polytolypa hystricis UAMH7299]
MPALSMTSLPNAIATANATSHNPALQVVCAWPVSGQYGPGTRVLYYMLIAACVLARKAVWLRNASLAAALLFPAVAAVHGIVLAAIHVDGAVDMDVYGAFQLCSIAILAAPVTVRLSQTYFHAPGRNTIFLWTGLILAGLLSLTVEFFRIRTVDCTHDDAGNAVSLNPREFSYETTTCGLTCSSEKGKGPFSPLREGSANEIYVIPAPDKLTFGTATLIAAACCIPAILSLAFMWTKILELNWKMRFSDEYGDEARIDEPIEGTNGATVGMMGRVNGLIRLFLSVVEIPVFSAAVLAILIMGERNFFSSQVNYQTEPITTIGQWAPIVGTIFALLGSLYLLLAADVEAVEEKVYPDDPAHHCDCCSRREGGSAHIVITPSVHGDSSNGDRGSISERGSTISRFTSGPGQPPERSWQAGKVAKALTKIGNYLSDSAHARLDVSEFKRGLAVDFPEIPGEEPRNRNLHKIRERYNPSRDADGNATPLSRVGSFSRLSVEGSSSTTPRAVSPQPPQSRRSLSTSPSPGTPQRLRASTVPGGWASFDTHNPPSSAGSNRGRTQRRDTLEVPTPAHHSPMQQRDSSPVFITSNFTVAGGQSSPAIIVSADPETYTPEHSPVLNQHTSHFTAEPLSMSPPRIVSRSP